MQSEVDTAHELSSVALLRSFYARQLLMAAHTSRECNSCNIYTGRLMTDSNHEQLQKRVPLLTSGTASSMSSGFTCELVRKH